jgi:hypothetical protein
MTNGVRYRVRSHLMGRFLGAMLLAVCPAACGDDDGGSADGSTTPDGAVIADASVVPDGAVGADASITPDAGGTDGGVVVPQGCPDPLPADWIFCEDFEQGTAPADVFFEHNDNNGDFRVVDTDGHSGTHAMEALWQSSEVGAGWVSVAFGRNPMVYGGHPHYRTDEDFEEIYWRMEVKHQQGWPDVGPAKLSRATAFAYSDWGQAMIAHLWSSGLVLLGDPASCVNGGTVDCHTYNDFANLDWLGQMPGTTELFSSTLSGQWHCVEGHVRLNTPGQADGVFEFWIDGNLENSRSDLDWRSTWTDYGLNLVSFENYWNSGAVQELRRWFDDIVIATVPIGCE